MSTAQAPPPALQEASTAELLALTKRMRAVSDATYWLFFNAHMGADVHAFIEFCGVLSKYVDICERSAARGIDFRFLNTHSGEALPVEVHDMEYLGEKLDCILGPAIQANPAAREALRRALFGAEPARSAAPASLRTVVYSPETTVAYAAVIDAGMTRGPDDMLVALRHLMMMVHCDFTGELRLPHTHVTEKPGRCRSCGVENVPEAQFDGDRCGYCVADEMNRQGAPGAPGAEWAKPVDQPATGPLRRKLALARGVLMQVAAALRGIDTMPMLDELDTLVQETADP